MNRIILSFFAATLFSLVNQPALAQGVLPDSIDIEYARIDTISLKLDVYLPKNATPPYPVIVWIHGGGWLAGSKENARAAFMVNFGYAVVSINYRFSPQAIFPAQIYDCKAAVRWIRANANQYNFDPERLGAWGLSAGAHLVSLLGTAADVDSLEGDVGSNSQFSSRVQAVCDWYGPSNFPTLL
ncbi:MAG: alpha/beta hydrolase fold domain-containing protein [Lysobacterales bacterium]